MINQNVNETIAKNLTKLLQERGLTQADLARKLGVSTATACNWCKGIKIPRMDKLDVICNYLEISYSDILEDEEETQRASNSNIMTRGERIKFLREAKGMSQGELAVKLGTLRQTIYKYEKNLITDIPPSKAEALAKALGTTPEFILGWEEKQADTAISEIDSQVLNILKDLNDDGKRAVLKYAEFLQCQGDYNIW